MPNESPKSAPSAPKALAALSVVIPARNAEAHLRQVLAALKTASVGEVIIADGDSVDATCAIAEEAGVRLVRNKAAGRGAQMKAGARQARGKWLLFLHADTVLSAGWADEAAAFIAAPDSEERAAVFRLAFDDTRLRARLLARLVAWRCALLRLPYGDQGLLVARHLYEEIGGYRALPLMEDVEITRRIGRRNLVFLDARATTSAQRYRRHGYLAQSTRNLLCLCLYALGVRLETIARIYRRSG